MDNAIVVAMYFQFVHFTKFTAILKVVMVPLKSCKDFILGLWFGLDKFSKDYSTKSVKLAVGFVTSLRNCRKGPK